MRSRKAAAALFSRSVLRGVRRPSTPAGGEPVAVVVGGQAAQEGQVGGGEAGESVSKHHSSKSDAISDIVCNPV